MKLDTEFIQLPLSYEVERLQEEVLAIPEREWRPHPQGHPGNSALPLLAVDGDPANDSTSGAMAPTPQLERCEYLRQVLASFETVLGRTRLMRLDGNAEATLHVDTNYYWAERVRVHVPIITSPAIEFICEERSLHMPEGEAWIFDAWRRHNVLNPTGDRRIHLVADTVGSSQFWDLVARGHRPFAGGGEDGRFETRLVPYRSGAQVQLETEGWNFSPVMSPWELERLSAEVVFDGLGTIPEQAEDEAALRRSLVAFARQWRAIWARHGPTPAGLDAFGALRDSADRAIERLDGKIRLQNGVDAVSAVRQLLLRPAVNPELMGNGRSPRAAMPGPQAPAERRVRRARASRFERPIFIVAPPRSGTSLVYETLALSPSVRTIGGESHREFESIPHLHPANRGWDSNRLGPTDARPRVLERLEANFMEKLQDRGGNPVPAEATGLRLLEKTPKNSLRVPFLNAAFPDALFIYIYREPQEALSSMIAAWESGRFRTYPDLPDWEGPAWSLVLTPEWRKLKGKELPEIVAEQWRMSSEILIGDLERLPSERWSVVGYHNFLADTQAEVERLCRFAEIDWDVDLSDPLPLSRHTLTPPRPDKWKQHAVALDEVLPRTTEVAERGRNLLARPVSLRPRAKDAAPEGDSPYRSVSGGDLPDILARLESTLLVSTYQTGKLVAVRELEGRINTHFRNFESPMGICHSGGRLAIGTKAQVCEYHNVPQICERLSPPDRYDACFVPRRNHYTGDISVHDVAFAGDELWVVNTRFSCLATLDGQHSFVPRWQPPFVTALAAEDRCHLNGLAVVDDQVRYVTALGQSDEPGGWRSDKAHGGVLIDVESGETVVSGLSMPHSPRWHRDRLWLLESGEGTLAVADLERGAVETVCELPGFTRGLAFAGPFAFVGLSEVREATTFGGLPLTGRLEERQCGVCVVNVATGKVVGLLRFEDLVQEIFDVELLPASFPEIAEHGSDAVNEAFVVPEPVS